MKLLLYTLMISACCGGMTHERNISEHHDEMPPIRRPSTPRLEILGLPSTLAVIHSSEHSTQIKIYEEQHEMASAIERLEVKTEPSKPATPSIESNSSTDSVSRSNHRRWLLISNGLTGLASTVITAAVALAIALNKCPTPPTGTGS